MRTDVVRDLGGASDLISTTGLGKIWKVGETL